MALLIAAAWVLIELKGVFPKGSAGRQGIVSLHNQLGLLTLLLLMVRVPWNFVRPVAAAANQTPEWTRVLAVWVKRSLYALMLAVPVCGIAALQAKGEAVPLLGFALPDFFGVLSGQRRALKEVHETLGNALLALAALHAAAGLWHHYVLHDDVLRRMLRPR